MIHAQCGKPPVVIVLASFSVPRLILTAASNYFAASLGSNFREGSNSEFLMEGTDGKTLKEIVDFLYTGQITLTEGNVEKFFAIASGVSFDMLEEKCCQFYAEKLSVTNSVATWMIADKFNNANLCETALTTICEAFEKVPAMDIHELQYRFILEILKSDKIQATEKFVFDRLLNWMEYKESDRQQHMPELLKLVRLAYIPTQVRFVPELSTDSFLSNNMLYSSLLHSFWTIKL